MESETGAFGTGIDAGHDDPFEEDGGFDQTGSDPFDEQAAQNGAAEVTQEPVEGRPIVDAEGNEVGDGEAATQVATDGGKEVQAEDPPLAEGAADPGSPSSESAQAESMSSGVTTDDDLPEEKKDAKGKVTHRKYLIFRPTGQGKFEQVTWHEDPDGALVPKGTEGSRKRSACLVRSKGDALALGYMAVGAPPEGADLVAVTSNYWVVKRVAPAPMVPTRSRLSIT